MPPNDKFSCKTVNLLLVLVPQACESVDFGNTVAYCYPQKGAHNTTNPHSNITSTFSVRSPTRHSFGKS